MIAVLSLALATASICLWMWIDPEWVWPLSAHEAVPATVQKSC